jgi:acylphosphatase
VIKINQRTDDGRIQIVICGTNKEMILLSFKATFANQGSKRARKMDRKIERTKKRILVLDHLRRHSICSVY